MDVIHYHMRIISRSKGSSAVASAAYRACERLYNKYNGQTYDYTKKRGIAYKQILLPDNAPRSFYDREILWNTVELKEKSQDARLAREVELSLPVELNLTEQIELINNYVLKCFVSLGMCADIVIHDKGRGNPHAHIMLTTRSLDEKGNWMNKQHKNYILDENGNKIYDPKTKQYKCGRSIKINDWDNEGNVEKWRKMWAEFCNREFQQKGIQKRVTHESYERQGINREPTKHLGHRVKALLRYGILTDREDNNRIIEARNKEREENEHLRQLECEQNRRYIRLHEIYR